MNIFYLNFQDEANFRLNILVRDRPQGVYVMTMTATDHDDPRTPNAKLTYEIERNKQLNGSYVFRIEPNTGKIYAMVRFFNF